MTEHEWLACVNSSKMLEFIRATATKRKLRLFAAACFRRLAHLLPDHRQQSAIEMLEDDPEEVELRRGVVQRVRLALPSSDDSFRGKCTGTNDPYFVGLMLYRELVSSSTAHHATVATQGLADGVEEQLVQSRLLRCIIGNPFRSVKDDPTWLAESNGTVLHFAQTIYDDRAFDRLPILADALEEAGCHDADILGHCRGEGPHVRGCWIVDLLLGKT